MDDYYNNALGVFDDGFDKELFERALDQWTERPLLGKGYNKRKLKLYDALIWNRVVNARDKLELIKNSIEERKKTRKSGGNLVLRITPKTDDDLLLKLSEINEDINKWKYTGKVYRVIECCKSKVRYHRLIASWVKDYDVFRYFNKLYKDKKYTFLVGDTGEDWGFDVNKYRSSTGNIHPNTEHESEIILPMDKVKYVQDIFYGTLDEFYEYLKSVV